MLHLLALPFALVATMFHLAFGLIFLPFKLLFGAIHLAFALLAFATCIVLSVLIGTSRGLNPLLCAVLGAFGLPGLVIVVLLALFRPARAY